MLLFLLAQRGGKGPEAPSSTYTAADAVASHRSGEPPPCVAPQRRQNVPFNRQAMQLSEAKSCNEKPSRFFENYYNSIS
jgi:hypothetical protein